eukprot:7528468-Alexandrium_andersonii.AAC.1
MGSVSSSSAARARRHARAACVSYIRWPLPLRAWHGLWHVFPTGRQSVRRTGPLLLVRVASVVCGRGDAVCLCGELESHG